MQTKGTELFYIDGSKAKSIGCPTNITGIDAPISPRDRTPLGADVKTSEPGIKSPGAVTISINYDPSDSSHKGLRSKYVNREHVQVAIGLSDGTASPSVSGGSFSLPNGRTWAKIEGYITAFPLAAKVGTIYKSSISLQQTSEPAIVYK